MNSRHIGADLVLAWPTAEIAVMGAKGAAEIIFRKEIAAADDPRPSRGKGLNTRAFAPRTTPPAADTWTVVHPRDTREKLIQAYQMLENKAVKLPRKKHSNIPL